MFNFVHVLFCRLLIRFGSDLPNMPIQLDSDGTPRTCSKLCSANTVCAAWVYGKAPCVGNAALCWLKSSVPKLSLDSCKVWFFLLFSLLKKQLNKKFFVWRCVHAKTTNIRCLALRTPCCAHPSMSRCQLVKSNRQAGWEINWWSVCHAFLFPTHIIYTQIFLYLFLFLRLSFAFFVHASNVCACANKIQANGLAGFLSRFWTDIEQSMWIGGTADTGVCYIFFARC